VVKQEQKRPTKCVLAQSHLIGNSSDRASTWTFERVIIPKTKSVACVVRQNVSDKRINEGEAVETKG